MIFNQETCTGRSRATPPRSAALTAGAILAALLDAAERSRPEDVQPNGNGAQQRQDQLLYKMAKAGDVLAVKRGQYVHCDRAGSSDTGNNDNSDNKRSGAHGH